MKKSEDYKDYICGEVAEKDKRMILERIESGRRNRAKRLRIIKKMECTYSSSTKKTNILSFDNLKDVARAQFETFAVVNNRKAKRAECFCMGADWWRNNIWHTMNEIPTVQEDGYDFVQILLFMKCGGCLVGNYYTKAGLLQIIGGHLQRFQDAVFLAIKWAYLSDII